MWQRKKRSKDTARAGERGYSLLEVLIVLSIIALIATFVGPRLMTQLDRSKVKAARVQIQALVAAIETMRLDIGRYPTDAEGLALLTAEPSSTAEAGNAWRGPYLDAAVPADPWGRPYVYAAPEEAEGRPAIASLGSDGKVGGEGLAADVRLGDPE